MYIEPVVFSFFAGVVICFLAIGFMIFMLNLIDILDKKDAYLILRARVVFIWGLASLVLAAALLMVSAGLSKVQGIS